MHWLLSLEKAFSPSVPSLQEQEWTWGKPCSALERHVPTLRATPAPQQHKYPLASGTMVCMHYSSEHQHIRGFPMWTKAWDWTTYSPATSAAWDRAADGWPTSLQLSNCFPACPATSSCLADLSLSPAAETVPALQLSACAPSKSINLFIYICLHYKGVTN